MVPVNPQDYENMYRNQPPANVNNQFDFNQGNNGTQLRAHPTIYHGHLQGYNVMPSYLNGPPYNPIPLSITERRDDDGGHVSRRLSTGKNYPLKLELYDGTTPVKNFLANFNLIAQSNEWSQREAEYTVTSFF